MMQSIKPLLRRKSEQAADIRRGTCPLTSFRFMTATAYGLLLRTVASPYVINMTSLNSDVRFNGLDD